MDDSPRGLVDSRAVYGRLSGAFHYLLHYHNCISSYAGHLLEGYFFLRKDLKSGPFCGQSSYRYVGYTYNKSFCVLFFAGYMFIICILIIISVIRFVAMIFFHDGIIRPNGRSWHDRLIIDQSDHKKGGSTNHNNYIKLYLLLWLRPIAVDHPLSHLFLDCCFWPKIRFC